MSMAEQRTESHDPPPSDDLGHIPYAQAKGYLAGRNVDREGLSWIHHSELEGQWSAVLDCVGENEFERLSR